MCGYFKEDQRVSLSRLVFFNCFFDQKISRDPTKRHTTLLVTNKEEHTKKNFFFFFFSRACCFCGSTRKREQTERSLVRSFVRSRAWGALKNHEEVFALFVEILPRAFHLFLFSLSSTDEIIHISLLLSRA